MNKKEKIEQEVEKTLAMFDKKTDLKPNPYFYTRVKQRIEEKRKPKYSVAAILKPAFFTMLLVLNVTTVVWYTNTDSIVTISETKTELADILKNDFNLDKNQSQSLIFE